MQDIAGKFEIDCNFTRQLIIVMHPLYRSLHQNFKAIIPSCLMDIIEKVRILRFVKMLSKLRRDFRIIWHVRATDCK